MPFNFTCPACQETLQLGNPGLAGKRIRCPQCGEIVTVPAAELVPELADQEPSPPPRSSRLMSPDRPARRRDEDEDEPRPRRRRRREPASGNAVVVWVLVGVGALLLVIAGAITAIIVINNARDPVTTSTSKTPAGKGGKAGQQPIVAGQLGDPNQVYNIPGNGLTLQDRLAVGDARDPRMKNFCKVYRVRMVANKTYTIRMNAQDQDQIDAVLRVENAQGMELAFNDDDPGAQTLNARIDFQCKQDGVYVIFATSLLENEMGNFTLTVHPIN